LLKAVSLVTDLRMVNGKLFSVSILLSGDKAFAYRKSEESRDGLHSLRP